MNNRSTAKKLLAILLSLTLIASCVVVAGVAAKAEGARGFEKDALDTQLALGNTYGNTMTVSSAQAHGGSQSLLVHTGKSGGSNRPQLLMQGSDGNDFKTAAGQKYRISFWYYAPSEQGQRR